MLSKTAKPRHRSRFGKLHRGTRHRLCFEQLEDRRLLTLVHPLELSTLNGDNGFTIQGINEADRSGHVVSSVGDVNNDTWNDVLIGARWADPTGDLSGQSYVVYGGPSLPDVLDLASLPANAGFRINGGSADERSGTSVSSAGDLNGDEIPDLIIGAPGDAEGTSASPGKSYVLFGMDGDFPSTVELSSLDGSDGFVISGILPGDQFGHRVSPAGDINGDGKDDLIVALRSDRVEAYVVFGRDYDAIPPDPQFDAAEDISDLINGTDGFKISGITIPNSNFFVDVTAAGDVDGDGTDDLLIGAGVAEESYVVFGKETAVEGNFPATFSLENMDAIDGFVIYSEVDSDPWGHTVSAGDVNDDGWSDLLIGDQKADPHGKSEAGKVYVVFGGPQVSDTDLANLNGKGFEINGIDAGDRAGSVSIAGDVNGDFVSDLIVGASQGSPNGFHSGESYVVFGNSNGFPASLDLEDLNGENGFAIYGSAALDGEFGFTGDFVSAAGDLNGDGKDDLIIGASGADPNGNAQAGKTYVVFGSDAPTVVSTSVSQTIVDDDLNFFGLYVGDSVEIQDLNVQLDITHTRNSDLDVFLISPSGTRVELFTDVGGSGDHFRGTILDDESGNPVTSGSAPFTGSYRAEASLSTFNEENAQGPWTLEITDDRRRHAGTLNGWSLIIDSTPPTPTPPSLSIDDVAVTEGDTGTIDATFTVTRSGDASDEVSVKYDTQDSTATAPDDYAAVVATTLTFLSGETSKTIDITVNGDLLDEGDHAFLVNLFDAVGATISDDQGVGTILDDDAPIALIHIGDLDGSGSPVTKGKWDATVTILVHDANHNPVEGAVVDGNWSNGASGSASCTTAANGECDVQKKKIHQNNSSVTFTVTTATHAADTYTPGQNHDDDLPSDSDGTIITVTQASGLHLAGPPAPVSRVSHDLTDETLQDVVREAIAMWAVADSLSSNPFPLDRMDVRLTSLDNDQLGAAGGTTIWIDRDAAGYGWSTDQHPGVDLLSVVTHELGHVLGLEHSQNEWDVMASTLPLGIRRLPSGTDASMHTYSNHHVLTVVQLIEPRQPALASSMLASQVHQETAIADSAGDVLTIWDAGRVTPNETDQPHHLERRRETIGDRDEENPFRGLDAKLIDDELVTLLAAQPRGTGGTGRPSQ